MALSCTPVRTRRFRLRDATHAAHVRLDDGIAAGGLLASRNAYIAYLQASLRARQPIETALDASEAQAIFAPWPQRRIADHLASDLQDLGGDGPCYSIAGPMPLMLPAEILGALYVLEGSALGGRLLFKRALTLGMTATLGARHLHAQTADPAAWRAFLEVLERQPMTPDEEALCERAALRTFKAFEFGLVGGGGLNAAAAQEERILVPL